MDECLIKISYLNDFVFCPVSIYFHILDEETALLEYQTSNQLNGTKSHYACDNHLYSDCKHILQGISITSLSYGFTGKIDVFDIKKGQLVERKKHIQIIYDGYVFQLYAQCICLREMGYTVNLLYLYSMDDNKMYPILLPENNKIMFNKFIDLLENISNFNFETFNQTNREKCENCIYENLCSFSLKGKTDVI